MEVAPAELSNERLPSWQRAGSFDDFEWRETPEVQVRGEP
jgi:hypothetical protein